MPLRVIRMAVVYSIRDWNQHFECAQSSRAKSLTWVAVPNKHDGKSFRRLMRMKNGIALYGAWILIVQVASKCPCRGVLADSDGPLSSGDIADKTLVDSKIIQAALDACCSREIGWIEKREITIDHDQSRSTTIDHDAPTRQDITRQDKTEQDTTIGGDEIGDQSRQPPKTAFDAAEVALPAELDTVEFRERWQAWAAYRRKKRKPISEDAAKRQLEELVRYGPSGAIESINASIANDWQGIFPPKKQPGQSGQKFSGAKKFLETHIDAK